MVWLLHLSLSTSCVFFLTELDAMEDMSHLQVEDKLFDEDWLKWFATEILDAKYENTDVAEIVKGLTHLNVHQKADLLWVLLENKMIFSGTFGIYPHKKDTHWHWPKCQACAL
jgi:hypothetical protein